MRYFLFHCISTILFFVPFVAMSAESGKKGDSPEAQVVFERKNDGVHYTITINPPFKMNLKAPFKFELRKSDTEILRKVPITDFSKDPEREVYRLVSTAGEKQVRYWFIACKYKGDEIVACKTFSAQENIP